VGFHRKFWRGGLAALALGRAGAVAAEFALIIPLLMTLVFGSIEMGSVFFSYSAMQFQATRAARAVAVNTSAQSAAIASAKAQMPAWSRNHVTIEITQTAPTDPNINLIRVRIALSSDHASPVTFISSLSPWPLVARVTVKQELPYVQ
jgi:Flp pilus assembly protein TadG